MLSFKEGFPELIFKEFNGGRSLPGTVGSPLEA
jgi:hypothetical protein